MDNPPLIIPTVVPRSAEDVQTARSRYSFVPALHIDVTDGVFAKNATWTPAPGYKLPDAAAVAYEVHLMAEHPLALGLAYAHAGAKRLIGHIESFGHSDAARDTFMMWRGAGVTDIGAAILLSTLPKELVPYAELIDYIHVMTIAEIGEQGQPFDGRSIERISRLRTQFPHLEISVDGGVGSENMRALTEAGVSRFCVGNALSSVSDPRATYESLSALCTTTA